MKIQPWKSWPSKFTKIKQEKSYATAYAGAVFGYYVRRYHLDELKRELAKSNYHSIFVGCKFGNEKSFTKNPTVARKIACHRLKIFWVLWSILVNLQKEFMKHVIRTSLI